MPVKNYYLLSIFLGLIFSNCYAQKNLYRDTQSLSSNQQTQREQNKTLTEKRAEKEEKINSNYYGIAFYKPTYILPYYYTGSPNGIAYYNQTPNNEKINRSEFKYQLSLKAPLWKNVYNRCSNLYIAYTQRSFWQVYNKVAFFRETDYEPEIFLNNAINFSIKNNFKLNFINIGAVHQSNGFGNVLERTWNRIYAELIFSNDNWLFSVKPWYIFNDSGMRKYNRDVAHYLGYGQVLFAYRFYQQLFSIQAYSGIIKRPSVEVTWSFPITNNINGFLQAFSGYGQSLIEYNHHTNSVGVGISLSNWI